MEQFEYDPLMFPVIDDEEDEDRNRLWIDGEECILLDPDEGFDDNVFDYLDEEVYNED